MDKKEKPTQFNKWKDRDNFKLRLIECAELVGQYQFPKLRGTKSIPHDLIPFNKAKTEKHPENKWVHFFIDDYQFERIWNYPNKYLSLLKRFEGVITTDFSMYLSMPKAQQIWSCYRNRVIAYWMQSNGINIVPTAGWSDKSSFKWCFDGLSEGSVVAVTSMGTRKNGVYKNNFNYGFYELINKVKPQCIVVYGELNYKTKELYPKTDILVLDNYCKRFKEMI